MQLAKARWQSLVSLMFQIKFKIMLMFQIKFKINHFTRRKNHSHSQMRNLCVGRLKTMRWNETWSGSHIMKNKHLLLNQLTPGKFWLLEQNSVFYLAKTKPAYNNSEKKEKDCHKLSKIKCGPCEHFLWTAHESASKRNSVISRYLDNKLRHVSLLMVFSHFFPWKIKVKLIRYN